MVIPLLIHSFFRDTDMKTVHDNANANVSIQVPVLDELMNLAGEIEKAGDASVIRLRGELLPFVDLAGVLGVDRSFVHPEDGRRYPGRRQTVADRRSKNHSAPKTDYDGDDRRLEQDRRHHAESALNIAVV